MKNKSEAQQATRVAVAQPLFKKVIIDLLCVILNSALWSPIFFRCYNTLWNILRTKSVEKTPPFVNPDVEIAKCDYTSGLGANYF
jgi:hypothetical protein